jgi:hypothetical protein
MVLFVAHYCGAFFPYQASVADYKSFDSTVNV